MVENRKSLSTNKASQKKMLDEINLLRPTAIFLILVLHCFTIYSGGWELPEGIERNFIYMTIARFSHSCSLETFAFMSGYLFFYGINECNHRYTLFSLIQNKTQRLIIPCIVFGILYKYLIEGIAPSLQGGYWYGVLVGVAHLWFLPMLFWCFIFSFLLKHWQVNEKVKIFILFLLCISPLKNLPLAMGNTSYYILFFYLGGIFRSRHQQLSSIADGRHVRWLAAVFLLTFCSFLYWEKFATDWLSSVDIAAWVGTSSNRFFRMLSSVFGVTFFYLSALYISMRYSVPRWLLSLNKCCFGIYVVHHFILPILYYHTALPAYLGSYVLPWGALVFTSSVSLGIVIVMRKTKWGKFLIG